MAKIVIVDRLARKGLKPRGSASAYAPRDHGGPGENPATRKCRLRSRTQTGFTLVETVVAMVVLGLMAGAVLGGLAWCISSVRLSRENLRATQIMVEKMEVIRLLTWDQITSNNIIPAKFTAPYYSVSGASNDTGGIAYYGTIAVLPPAGGQLGATYTNDMRVISVQLLWTNRGLPHQRQLTSYVSRYGIQNYELN